MQILSIHNQKITSPTSLRVQGVSNENAREDFCTELMSNKMVNGTVVHNGSGHLLEGLALFGDSSDTPWLLPTAFLQSRVNQY